MIAYPYKSFKPDNYGKGNRAGTYILGSAYAWHGGLHLETNDDLMAIADGTLVAYRVADKYTEEEIEGVGNTRFSNCFAILRHEHDADDLKFTYYSLYNHLWTASEMKNQFVSELFQKCTWVVDKEEQSGTYGIWGYRVNSAIKPITFKKERKLFPLDCILEVHEEIAGKNILEGAPLKRMKGDCLKVKEKQGFTLPALEQFFYVVKSEVEVCGEEIIYEGLEKKTISLVKAKTQTSLQAYDFQKNASPAGIRHYSKQGDASSVAAIMGVIPKGTSIILSGKPVKGKWHKVLDKGNGEEGGYVLLTGKETLTVSSEFKPDEIVGCHIPVKAGTIIGKAGDFGHEIDRKYKDSCHFEIFTADDVEAFLNNESEKQLNYLKVNTDVSFSGTFEIAQLPKGYPVEVIDKKGFYSKVKVPILKKLVPYEYLGIYSEDDDCYALQGETDKSYVPRQPGTEIVKTTTPDLPQANLAGLKELFGDFLTADHRLKFIKKDEEQREVSLVHAMAGKEMWIRTDQIEEPLEPIAPLGASTTRVQSSAQEAPSEPSFIISVHE